MLLGIEIYYSQEQFIEIKGNLFDAEDSTIIPQFEDVSLLIDGTWQMGTIPDSNGHFRFLVDRGLIKNQTLEIRLSENGKRRRELEKKDVFCPNYPPPSGYLQQRETVTIKDDKNFYVLNIKLRTPSICYSLPGVYFKKNSTQFIECCGTHSDTSLYCVRKLLNDQDDLLIEVQVHSWNELNIENLTNERGKYVVNRLISLGVDSTRIKFISFEDKKPRYNQRIIVKAKTKTQKELYESENRRAVFNMTRKK